MRSWLTACITLLILGGATSADVWTETFDAGVGRLDQTVGDAESNYWWEESSQSIYATCYRNSISHHRFAWLDQPFDSTQAVRGFRTVITPVDTNGGAAGFKVGFIRPDENRHHTVSFNQSHTNGLVIQLDNGSINSSSIGNWVPFDWGNTYCIDALIDGPNDLFSANVYRGVDTSGEFLGSGTLPEI